MPALALFGITNDGLDLAVNLLVLCLVFIYLALIAWTYFDARRRIDDSVLIGCSVALSLLPVAGPIIYSILRPPEFIDDQRERELEIKAAELRVRQIEEQSCPSCAFPIERDYLRCPSCRARVKDPCESCGRPIDPRWALCPYCEAPNRRSAQPPARRGPREARAQAPRQAASSAPPRRRRSADGTGKAPAPKAPAPKRATKPAARQSSGSRPARTGQQRAAAKEQPAPRGDAPPPSPAGDAGGEERSRPAKT